jgi:hypothetical protein
MWRKCSWYCSFSFNGIKLIDVKQYLLSTNNTYGSSFVKDGDVLEKDVVSVNGSI